MTYQELQDAVESWLNREDLTATIPTFIALAEAALSRRVRTRDMLVTTDVNVAAEFANLPADYAEWRALSYETADGPVALQYVTPERADVLMPSAAAAPRYFTVDGGFLRFVPVPDTVYFGTLRYYAKIPALSPSNTTNWLLDSHPDVYLYAALAESAPFLRDDDRVVLWAGELDKRVNDLVVSSERSEFGGGPLRAAVRVIGE